MTEDKQWPPTKCACGEPVYDQCSHCGGFFCGKCLIRLRNCKPVESGRHLPGHLPDPQILTFENFHNALRVMLNIDRDQWEEAIGYSDAWLAGSGKTRDDHWAAFRSDPWAWFIRAGDKGARGIFALVQRRMAK